MNLIHPALITDFVYLNIRRLQSKFLVGTVAAVTGLLDQSNKCKCKWRPSEKNTGRLTVTYQPMATLSDGAWEVQKRPTSAHSISSISRPPSIFGRPAPSIWVNEIGRITFHPRQNVNLISRRIFCFWLSALRSNYHCVRVILNSIQVDSI